MSADSFLDISPEKELSFELSSEEESPRCIMDLQHPDPSGPPIAFKVKTTQPRRYLVRPNQGLIEPGSSQQVQILLVEKEKISLLSAYQRLGQATLDQSKDKFLVQSVAVDAKQADNLKDYDQLTSLWATVSSGGGAGNSFTTAAVANKKLHVKHTVSAADKSAAAATAPNQQSSSSNASKGIPVLSTSMSTKKTPATPNATTDPEQLSQAELVSEVHALRRKYDELVGFSVNLTAERDVLNNTLEQTKRDLNRELALKKAGTATATSRGNVIGFNNNDTANSTSLARVRFQTVLVATVFFLLGVRLEQLSLTGFLRFIPIFGSFFETVPDDDDVLEL